MNTFSLIIPTYNEEVFLPKLLQSVKKQSSQPTEIIVADNSSFDKTRMIAKSYGCKVISGGLPATGRNKAAAKATANILVFMDSDTRLRHNNFFELAVNTFTKQGLDIAMCFALNEHGNRLYGHFAVYSTNVRKIVDLIVSQLFRTVLGGSGWFIMVKKEIFNKMSGFDEDFVNYEDTDFVKRVVSSGFKFGILPYSVYLSGRRYDKMNLSRVVKTTVFITLFKLGMWLKIKDASKYLKKYEKAKGPLGGENRK